MQVSTQVIGRPPCTPPTMLLANSTRRREMPPVSIMLPARIKKGIAASGNLLIELKISFASSSMLALAMEMPAMLANPIDTAIDIEKAKHTSIVTSMVVDMVAAFCVSCVSGQVGSGCGFEFQVARIEEVADRAHHRAHGADRQGQVSPEHRERLHAD